MSPPPPSDISVPSGGPTGPLRLAILGLWHIHTPGLVRQIAAHPGEFRLLSVWDPEPAVVEARRAAWNLPDTPPSAVVFADSLEAALTTRDAQGLGPQAVAIEGRVHQNLWWAVKAIEAGCHVLLEKPAGCDLDEFEALHELATQRRCRVQIAYVFRHLSSVLELRRRVARGDLGRITSVRLRLPKPLAEYHQQASDLARYRGGMFFEMAGHAVDLIVSLLGRPVAVHPILRHHHHQGPAGYIDNAVAVLEYPTALATIEVNNLETVSQARRVEVYGTGGAVVIPHLGSGHLDHGAVMPIEFCPAGEEHWSRLDLPANPVQIGDLRTLAKAIAERDAAPDLETPSGPAAVPAAWAAEMAHDRLVQEVLLRASGMLTPGEGEAHPGGNPPGGNPPGEDGDPPPGQLRDAGPREPSPPGQSLEGRRGGPPPPRPIDPGDYRRGRGPRNPRGDERGGGGPRRR